MAYLTFPSIKNPEYSGYSLRPDGVGLIRDTMDGKQLQSRESYRPGELLDLTYFLDSTDWSSLLTFYKTTAEATKIFNYTDVQGNSHLARFYNAGLSRRLITPLADFFEVTVSLELIT